eukprot:GFYU01004048.1.p1 GENE.GFYU01004048.1~~GFYU01004048.1.p1  ORF type:complete len:114 (-),score=41.58 GFYU01004048.1:328-669(-)
MALAADTSKAGLKLFKYSKFAMVGFPLAFVTPDVVSTPLNTAFGIVLPLHAHVGVNGVITDYVPRAAQSLARVGLAGWTGITILGLLKLNLAGPGISGAFGALWKEDKVYLKK